MMDGAFPAELVQYVATQSWQIAVLVVTVGVITFALCRRSAHVRYLLWLLVVAKCLVPPLHVVPLRVLPSRPISATAATISSVEIFSKSPGPLNHFLMMPCENPYPGNKRRFAIDENIPEKPDQGPLP